MYREQASRLQPARAARRRRGEAEGRDTAVDQRSDDHASAAPRQARAAAHGRFGRWQGLGGEEGGEGRGELVGVHIGDVHLSY
eukprot:5812175-Prymnesium_polylepis.1